MRKISEIRYNRDMYYLVCPACKAVWFDDVPRDDRNKYCQCGQKLVPIYSDNETLTEAQVLELYKEKNTSDFDRLFLE